MTKTCGFRHIAVGVMALLVVSPAVFAATATINFDTSSAGINCAQNRVPPLFNRPAYGSQTAAYIRTPTACDAGSLGVNNGNDSLLQNSAGLYLSAPYSNELRWSWADSNDANAWLRLLSYAAQSVTPAQQAPIISFEPGSSVAMDILVYGVDALGAEVTTGGLELCLTARETGQNLPLGYKGSTSGAVEYLGVTGVGGGGVTPDTRTPVGGVLLTDNATQWYHVVWTIVDATHVDVSVQLGTGTPVVSNLLVAGFPGSGNGTLSATPTNRGILDGIAIRKPVADTTTVQWWVDVDNIIIDAPGIDPVVVQGPLSQLRSKVTVTNIDPTATQVTLYANGSQIAFATTGLGSGTYQFTGLVLNATDVITATQTVGGVESAASSSITVNQYELLEDFTGGVTWTRSPATAVHFRDWYEVNNQGFGTASAGTLDSSACLHYIDSGYMNGFYAIYSQAVPSTKTNYVVSAKVRLTEGTDTGAIRSYEMGAKVNGVHRDVTSAATPGSNTYRCHNESLLAVDTNTGGYASFAGLTSGNDTGTQTLTTGKFSAAENDNMLVVFSTNVHTRWQDIAIDTTTGRLDTVDPCETPTGFPITTPHPVPNAQGTWNVSTVNPYTGAPFMGYNTSAAWAGGYIDVDDIRLDLYDMCASVTSVSIGSIVSTNQTCVTVGGVNASATAINVYSNVSTLIGTLTTGIVAGSNTVTLTAPLVAGQKISATQVIGGQEGCKATAPQKTVGDTTQVTQLTLTGPLNAGATSVTVNFVDASASVVNVYDGATVIGSLSTGIVAGTNVVPTSALALHHSIQARQTVPVGCSGDPITSNTGVAQVVGTGHNSNVRLSLGVREVTGISGPPGAPAYSNSEGIEWIIPIDAGDATSGLKTGGAPIGHKVLTSPDWQTVTFDPVTAGAANVVSFNLGDGVLNPWVGIEHLAITMDQDAKDVGPYKMYVDNIKNGTDMVQDFNTTVTMMFKTPGASGSTAGYLASNPSASTSDASHDSADATGRSHRIEWRWNQEGSTGTYMWVRLTADQTASAPIPGGQPQIDTTKATTMRVFLPCPGPAITAQPSPASQTLVAGSSVTYSVTATSVSGNPLSYQWYKGAAVLTDGGSISGATTASLTINPLVEADAGTYSVKVTDVCGTATSSNVTLGVCVPVSITGQPTNVTVTAGGNASFTVAATGSGTLAYQWRKGGTNLSNGGTISGATTATLTITGVVSGDAGSYDCVVSNGCGTAATSNPATLTVTASTVTLSNWRSLKTHSGYGEIAITLNAAAVATGQAGGGIKVESRFSATQNGLTKVQIDVSAPVTVVNPSLVTITGLSTSGCDTAGNGCTSAAKVVTPTITMAAPQTLQLAFASGTAASESCYIIAIQDGALSANITGDRDCKVRVLYGDASGDGLVNIGDLSYIKFRLSQPITSANASCDVNLAAGINLGDLSSSKFRLGRRAICP